MQTSINFQAQKWENPRLGSRRNGVTSACKLSTCDNSQACKWGLHPSKPPWQRGRHNIIHDPVIGRHNIIHDPVIGRHSIIHDPVIGRHNIILDPDLAYATQKPNEAQIHTKFKVN